MITNPRRELEGLLHATVTTPADLAARTGIPKTRISDFLRGFGSLSIDDLTLCKAVLREIVVEKATGMPTTTEGVTRGRP